MSEEKMMRLSQAARKAGISVPRAAEFLATKGFVIENNPNSKITSEQYELLMKEFESSANETKEAKELSIGRKPDNIVINATNSKKKHDEEDEEILIKNLISDKKEREKTDDKEEVQEIIIPKEKKETPEVVKEEENPNKLQGIKVLGKIDLTDPKKGKKTKEEEPVINKKEEVPVVKEEKTPEPEVKPEKEVIKPKEEVKVKETPVQEIKEKEVEKEKEKPKEEVKTVVKEPVENIVTPEETEVPTELIEAKAETLKGLTVLGKIQLPVSQEKKKGKPEANSNSNSNNADKKKRKRITSSPVKNFTDFKNDKNKKPGNNQGGNNQGNRNNNQNNKQPATDKEIQDKIKSTLAKLSGGNKGPINRSKYRKDKRNAMAEADKERELQQQEEEKILKVTEFISANDLASMMNVSVNEVIGACLSLGMFVSINQRLDAEAITVIADEFGYSAKFVTAEEEVITTEEEEDDPEDLVERAPIVTIMGHVDHGKTSLLDYIRKTRIAHGEAGGITQHVGAYDVQTDSGKRITFLDTPGHEAFTAMRARGAKITDIVIIVVAADDSVMPQTKEAINHARNAGVPIIIAINKVDKPAANPDKIKEELAKENILVEDWGGKYQCEQVSAKSGIGIPQLLEKILLEAELLQLKANPDKNASGSVIEASLDKGRGYVANVMIQTGTLEVGDIVLAGANFGRVRAMLDHKGKKLDKAGPSTPVQILGLNGAPQAGDKIQVFDEEREAREIATKREQLMREQSIRTKKHITLDEIGRRLAIGNFKELNIIIKGDVDGSVEALSDSMLKLSTEEIQVRIIHKAVGAISESDVLLASASDAVIVGFQVRPTPNSRKLAEKEQIEIRMYSIIYDAINDVKAAMEGMLEPKMEEVVTATLEIRQVFTVSKVGAIAGCYVLEGMIKRNHQVRVVRDGIVMHTGKIDSLKRVKDDVSEVKTGFECGLMVQNFNNIEVGDLIEAFEMKEVKRKL